MELEPIKDKEQGVTATNGASPPRNSFDTNDNNNSEDKK